MNAHRLRGIQIQSPDFWQPKNPLQKRSGKAFHARIPLAWLDIESRIAVLLNPIKILVARVLLNIKLYLCEFRPNDKAFYSPSPGFPGAR